MKKKILAMLLACAMLAPTSAYTVMAEEAEATEEVAEEATEETEASDATLLTMQGIDDQNIIWTLVIDSPNAVACVSLAREGQDTTYIAGPIVFDTDAGTFTITDDEDGNDYTFGFQDISATETIMTYDVTGSEVQLATVEQNTVESAETSTMEIFAGVEDDGSQLTMGFDYDTMEMAVDERSADGTVTQMTGTFEADNEAMTLTFHSNEAGDIVFGVATVEGTDNQLDITLNDATVRITKVDMNAISTVTGEETAAEEEETEEDTEEVAEEDVEAEE